MSESEAVHRPRKPQADHNHALIEYHNWLKDTRVLGSGCLTTEATDPDCRFVPKSDLQHYLKKETIVKILRVLGIRHHSADVILKDYLKNFAILLSLDHGKLIEWFLQYDSLSDKKLPFETCPPTFPQTSDPNFFNTFSRQQWMFCAPTFSCRKHYIWALNDGCILPIVEKEELGRGGSSVTYKIRLHPYYDRLIEKSDQKKGNNKFAHVYVLKTYNTHDAETRYRKELSAFIYLRKMQQSTRSVIQFYGSFKHCGAYSLILEYADKGTLEQYFQTTERPSNGPDIRKFWKSILQLTKALSRIHEVEAADPGDSEIFYGWHQDVKPENILVSTRGDKLEFECEFKLADLGLSHFKIAGGDAEDRDSRGTRTYGAPECYRSNTFQAKSRLKVTPKVDIWSLGSVLSEAAVWLVRGKTGLDNYRRERREEMEQRDPDFTDLGCFHDGTEVLGVVIRTHDMLLEDLPRSDNITDGVLELVQRMLKKVQVRPTAFELVDMMEDTFKKSQKHQISHKPHDSGKAEASSPIRAQSLPAPRHPPGTSRNRPAVQSQSRGELSSGEFGSPTGYMEDGFRITEEPQSESPDAITGFEEEIYHQSFDDDSAILSPHYRGVSNPRTESEAAENWGSSTILESSRYLRGDDEQFSSAFSSSQINAAGSSMKNHGKPLLSYADRKRAMSDSPNNFANVGGGFTYQTNASRIPSGSPVSSSVYSPTIRAAPASPFKNSYSTVSSMVDSNVSDHNKDKVVIQQSSQGSEVSRANDVSRGSPVHAKEKLPDLPYISFDEAYKWRQQRQKRSKEELCAEHVLERLNRRDHVFIIDNSPSMRQYWPQVLRVLEVLAYITKEKDPNKLELYFTMEAGKFSGSSSTGLVAAARPRKATDKATGLSDLYPRIRDIFSDYKKNLKRKSFLGTSSRRPMSLYILTDGNWQPPRDTEECIAQLVRDLDMSDQYQVGIEFIHFGNNRAGRARLEHLDDGLKEEFNLKWDIVDMEPADGNILKMLLGAINKWFDGDKDQRSPTRGSTMYLNGSPLQSPPLASRRL